MTESLQVLLSELERFGEANDNATIERPLAQRSPPRPTVPGIGTRLRLVLREDIHAIHRFPRGQDVVSSCRLVTGAKASAGTRHGTAGTKIGKAHRTWACSEAAVWFLRDQPAAQTSFTRLEKHPDTGQALTVLAHK